MARKAENAPDTVHVVIRGTLGHSEVVAVYHDRDKAQARAEQGMAGDDYVHYVVPDVPVD